MNTEKIIKKELPGEDIFRVHCPKTKNYKDVSDCKSCSRFSRIDVVSGSVICRNQKRRIL